MSCQALMAAVNEFTGPSLNAHFAATPEMEQQYASQAPLFAVVFHTVRAVDKADALEYAFRTVSDINTILAAERGASPRPFASFIEANGAAEVSLFVDPYRGNMIAPFSPTQHGERIERELPTLRRSARARLLMESYAQAVAERDHAFIYLRYWAVLELIAKSVVTAENDEIVDAHGAVILGNDGRPIRTKGAAAKVYKYIFDADMGASSGSYSDGATTVTFSIEAQRPRIAAPNEEVISLWDAVGGLVEIRNSVAHTGAFYPDPTARHGSRLALASRFWGQPFNPLFDLLKSATMIAVYREVAKE